MKLELGTAQRPYVGEKVSGDAICILQHGEETLVTVVDGLGHGPKAAEAANAFCGFVESNQFSNLEEIMLGATKDIARTRGAVAALIRINGQEDSMCFCGVGNIELQALSRHPIRPVCTPGIVGRPIRKVLSFSYEMLPGDLMVVHTDGISSRFDLDSYRHLDTPEAMAEAILSEHGKNHDDATCVVFRCV